MCVISTSDNISFTLLSFVGYLFVTFYFTHISSQAWWCHRNDFPALVLFKHWYQSGAAIDKHLKVSYWKRELENVGLLHPCYNHVELEQLQSATLRLTAAHIGFNEERGGSVISTDAAGFKHVLGLSMQFACFTRLMLPVSA